MTNELDKQPDQLRLLAEDRWDYCRIPGQFDPLPFQPDHIIAQQHGGETVLDNLAWSCLHDNKHKGPNIAGIDPVSGDLVPLFHPHAATSGTGDVIMRGMEPSSWDEPGSVGQRFEFWPLTIRTPRRFRADLMEEGVFF